MDLLDLKNHQPSLCLFKMFATVIQYRLNPIFESDFISIWKQQRDFLKERDLITESMLHRETRMSFVSYTRWKSQDDFNDSMVKPRGQRLGFLQKQESFCNSIKICFRLNQMEIS